MNQATHKAMSGMNKRLFVIDDSLVSEWNGLTWVKLDFKCSIEDYIKMAGIVSIDEDYVIQDRYKQPVFIKKPVENIYYPNRKIGAYQGD